MKIRNPWRDKTRERIRRLASGDLLEWADSALVASWQAAERYGKGAERADLEEAFKEGGVYLAILDELRERGDAENRAF